MVFAEPPMNQSKTNQSDHQIIRLTLSGDKEMFGLLVHKYQNRLFNSMVQVTRSESEAEERCSGSVRFGVQQAGFLQGQQRLFYLALSNCFQRCDFSNAAQATYRFPARQRRALAT